jgi:sec-independent protein translocase protein TatA
MVRGLFEGWHPILLVLVLVLLFGAKRLPDAARGLGRSLRIFKAETEGLRTDGARSEPGSARDQSACGSAAGGPASGTTKP